MLRRLPRLRRHDSQRCYSTAQASSLPIVSVAAFLDGSNATDRAKTDAAALLDAACRDRGFFYLKDHGVDPALINEVRDLSREFFTLPQAEKDGYAMVPGTGRGYAAMGVNVTQGKADWHEGVDLFREIPDDHRLLSPARPRSPAAETILRGKNPIVIRPAELGAVVDRYVDQMLETSWAVMRMMSVGLGLPERALVDGFCTEPYWGMRMIAYPPIDGAPADGEVGLSCGEHTDYGCLTLVNQDPVCGSLQVKAADGSWTDADPVDGCFVVNIGDMMSLMTRGLYQSTPHRVLHSHPTSTRLSVPFFFEPNFDAVMRDLQLPGGGSPRSAAAVHTTTYGQHLVRKLGSNFKE